MKYCRSCGSALAQTSAGSPALAGRPGSAPMSTPSGGPMPGMASGPIGGFPSQPAGAVPPFGPIGGLPSRPAGAVPPFGPIGGMPGMGSGPTEPTVPASASPVSLGMMPTNLATPALRAQGSTISCPRCGTQTPLGFAYCQQCGLHIQAVQPTDPVASVRPAGPPAPPPLEASFDGGKLDASIDPHPGTIAQGDLQIGTVPGRRAVMVADSGPQPSKDRNPLAGIGPMVGAGPGWGTAVLVNRDGSDGQCYPLAGEYLVIGRAGCDIAFDDDRFLARQHARIERGSDGAIKIHPLDTLNGVFRKTGAPVELVDGMTILVGREVLRYERVEPEERTLQPLVRHGVALFGSPPREPWGRLVQLVPSGGYRDVRHLAGDEVVLGREEGEIVFRDDAFMSRRHAAVIWDGKRAQITDLGSSNGTFVRITGPTALMHGDHVRLGDQLLRIELGR